MYTDGTYKRTLDDKWERVTPSAGYWVSSTNNPVTGDVAEEMEAVYNEQNAQYVGIWTADNGTRFVDKSHYVKDRDVAEAAGRFWKQEAIWDILREREVFLD